MLNSNRRRGFLYSTKNQVNLHYVFHSVILYDERSAFALCMFWFYILRTGGPDQSYLVAHSS